MKTTISFLCSLTDGCPSEVIDGFTWPESDLNLLGPVGVSCDCGNLDTTVVSLQAIRNCTGSYTDGAMWVGRGNSTACRFSSNVASLCGITTVSPFLKYYNYCTNNNSLHKFYLQGTTEDAVATVLALTQDTASVTDPTAVTIAVSILSQNTSAFQNDTVIE